MVSRGFFPLGEEIQGSFSAQFTSGSSTPSDSAHVAKPHGEQSVGPSGRNDFSILLTEVASQFGHISGEISDESHGKQRITNLPQILLLFSQNC